MSEEYLFHTRKKPDLFSYPYRMREGNCCFVCKEEYSFTLTSRSML